MYAKLLKYALLITLSLPLALSLGCGGDDDAPDSPTSTPTLDPLAALEAQLEAALLTLDEVPDGMQPAGLTFTSNEDAASNAVDPRAELLKLNQAGRLLAADQFFSPFGELPEDEPVKGGIQHTVVFYLTAEDAQKATEENIEEAMTADFAGAHAGETDVKVQVLPREAGDESIWFRVTGITNTGALNAALIVDDQIIFRSGRVAIFLRVLSSFPAGSADDVFADRVQQWADLAAQKALSALSGATPPADGTTEPAAEPAG